MRNLYFLILFLFPVAIFAVGDLSAPTIAVNPDIYYPQDEILYLEGRALPISIVQIQFQKQGSKSASLNVKSDSNGEWVLSEKVPLEAGEWEVRARIIDSSGKTSEWSNPRVLKAIRTGVVIGGFTVKFAFLLFIFLVILALSVFLVFYFYFRMRSFQSRAYVLRVKNLEKELREKTEKLEEAVLSKEKEEAKMEVEKGFSELKNVVLTELEHLEKISGGRILTPEEVEHKERLISELKNIEDKIETKIKSIDHNA